VAFGNLLQGLPFGFDERLVSTYTGSFWALFSPFALLSGVVASAMITLHGGIYLVHGTEGAIQRRALRAAIGAAMVTTLAFVAAGAWLRWGGIQGFQITSVVDPAALPDPLAKSVVRSAEGWWLNYARWPALWLLPVLGALMPGVAAALSAAGRTLAAFVASSLMLASIIGTAGAAMFPFVMPSSTQPDASLTVWDSTSSHLTLALMFWATLIFMPLIVLYTGWAYRVMRGKVTVEHIQANQHTAY